MSMCRVVSCVVGRGCFLWTVHPFAISVSLFPVLYSKAKLACYSRYRLTSILHSSALWWRGHLFWVLVLGLFHGTIQFRFLQHWWLRHRLRLLWYWIVCLGKEDHSDVLDIGPNYCILDSLVTIRAIPYLLRDSCPP